MKAKYKDFIKENPTCSQFKENKDMKALFRLLNSDPMIIQMIESADQDKPALAGVLGALEAWYRDKKAPSIDLGGPLYQDSRWPDHKDHSKALWL